jgi:GlpG protein
MRIIGYLPSETSASTFSEFLGLQGISNVVEAEKDRWAVWIHSEDELEKATTLLSGFLGNPADPKFQGQARAATAENGTALREEPAATRRVFDRTKVFRLSLPYGIGPLTLLLVLACVAIWAVAWLHPDNDFLNSFFITKYDVHGNILSWKKGLPEIRHGEVWRLVTPIFLHEWTLTLPFHLLFNVYALFILGSIIEARRSTWLLGALVLVIAAISNLAQYAIGGGPNFCGISGVVYGLFGFIWIKGKFDPASGLYLHPQTVIIMLIWFFVGLSGLVGGIANTAHGAGLVVGMAWGFFSSLPALRNRAG